jgi:hypothetical protein
MTLPRSLLGAIVALISMAPATAAAGAPDGAAPPITSGARDDGPRAATPTEESRYAAREAAAVDLEQFAGGRDDLVIVGVVLLVVLVVILII